MADEPGRETCTALCPIAKKSKEKRKERTCMEALRVVLHEHDSKRMKRTGEIEQEVRCVEGKLRWKSNQKEGEKEKADATFGFSCLCLSVLYVCVCMCVCVWYRMRHSSRR